MENIQTLNFHLKHFLILLLDQILVQDQVLVLDQFLLPDQLLVQEQVSWTWREEEGTKDENKTYAFCTTIHYSLS